MRHTTLLTATYEYSKSSECKSRWFISDGNNVVNIR